MTRRPPRIAFAALALLATCLIAGCQSTPTPAVTSAPPAPPAAPDPRCGETLASEADVEGRLGFEVPSGAACYAIVSQTGLDTVVAFYDNADQSIVDQIVAAAEAEGWLLIDGFSPEDPALTYRGVAADGAIAVAFDEGSGVAAFNAQFRN